MALTKVKGSGISDAVNSAISANTAKVTNYNQTKADIEALGIDASSLTGSLPAISGANLTGIETVTKSTTAPSSPTAGDMWFNSSGSTVDGIASKCMASYSGTEWLQMSNKFSATGGTESTYSSGGVSYKVHTFTSSGTFTVGAAGSVDYLVVAGGGGSGGIQTGSGAPGYVSGAGGAGGMRTGTLSISAQAYPITIGQGGGVLSNGGNSTFSSITSLGGGYGATSSTGGIANSGGSGGGGSHVGYGSGGGAGTSGQGNSGALGNNCSGAWSGGGGGAGGAAPSGSCGAPGVGGAGAYSAISGTNTAYAGGGGGGGGDGHVNNGAVGGVGGGGTGTPANPTNGSVNTGGGAGSGAAAGGSGIVIIRYAV